MFASGYKPLFDKFTTSVWKSLVAPFLSNSSTISRCPFFTAKNNGVSFSCMQVVDRHRDARHRNHLLTAVVSAISGTPCINDLALLRAWAKWPRPRYFQCKLPRKWVSNHPVIECFIENEKSKKSQEQTCMLPDDSTLCLTLHNFEHQDAKHLNHNQT